MSTDPSSEYQQLASQVARSPSPRIPTLTEFADACREGRLDVVRQMWEITSTSTNPKDKLDLESPSIDYNGFAATVLMITASENRVEVVRYLVEICHVDIERRELHYGDNALLFAAYYGSLQTFQYLYEECRSSFLIKNNLGITPLMYACEQGKAEIVTYILQQVNLLIDNHTLSLIQAREYVNSRVYNGGITALLYSVLINRIDLIRLLGDCVYCDVNVSTVDGKTPLIYATQFRRVDIVKYLAEEHAQTDMYAQVVSGEDVLAFIGRETATEEPEEDEEILIKRKQEEDEIRRIILAARSTRVPVSKLTDSSAETIRTLREEVDRLKKRERELEDEVETWRNRCEVLLSKDSLLGQQDEEVRAWKRKREEEQVKLCVACCSHERNTVYIPCGHMVMCVSCNEMEHRQHLINSSNSHSSGGIGERVCCVCRTRVTSVRQVYC